MAHASLQGSLLTHQYYMSHQSFFQIESRLVSHIDSLTPTLLGPAKFDIHAEQFLLVRYYH